MPHPFIFFVVCLVIVSVAEYFRRSYSDLEEAAKEVGAFPVPPNVAVLEIRTVGGASSGSSGSSGSVGIATTESYGMGDQGTMVWTDTFKSSPPINDEFQGLVKSKPKKKTKKAKKKNKKRK